MICTWTSSGLTNFAICGSDDMQCRNTFSTEAHSLILMICTWTVQVYTFCGSDDMQYRSTFSYTTE